MLWQHDGHQPQLYLYSAPFPIFGSTRMQWKIGIDLVEPPPAETYG